MVPINVFSCGNCGEVPKGFIPKMSNYEQNLVKLFGNDYVDNLVPSEEELEQKYSVRIPNKKVNLYSTT